MTLSEKEKRTVLAVFHELKRMPYSKLNTFLGSMTIREMYTLSRKLELEDYCTRKGIRFEDMTEEDFEDAAFEEARERGYAV